MKRTTAWVSCATLAIGAAACTRGGQPPPSRDPAQWPVYQLSPVRRAPVVAMLRALLDSVPQPNLTCLSFEVSNRHYRRSYNPDPSLLDAVQRRQRVVAPKDCPLPAPLEIRGGAPAEPDFDEPPHVVVTEQKYFLPDSATIVLFVRQRGSRTLHVCSARRLTSSEWTGLCAARSIELLGERWMKGADSTGMALQ